MKALQATAWALPAAAALLATTPTSGTTSTARPPPFFARLVETPAQDTASVTGSAPLEGQQEGAADICASFAPDTFDPLIRDCHVQTIGGFLLRGTAAAYVPRFNLLGAAARIFRSLPILWSDSPKSGAQSDFWDARERIDTPDGDFFHVDTKHPLVSGGAAADSRVILLHGLESNSDSELSRQIAAACVDNGMAFTCINFRSCSEDREGNLIPNLSLGGYHLGFTDDFMQYLELCRVREPDQKIYVMGFSLGSNAALKALGDLGEQALARYNIRGASLLCTPLNQEVNARALARPGVNRAVYTNSLLKKMKAKAQEQLDRFCGGDEDTHRFDFTRAMAAETITEFDDAFIAPIYGFTDCWDYYRKTSSIYVLQDVKVPTYILNASDDPFFDPSVLPVEKTFTDGGPAPVLMRQANSGGHLGFCFHQVEANDPRLTDDSVSWAPREAARFLQHVDECQTR